MDIALDENLDLLIKDGDIVFIEHDEQHLQDVRCAVRSGVGEWFFYPPLGIGINQLIQSDLGPHETMELKRRATMNLKFLNIDGTISYKQKSGKLDVEVVLK